jgi:fluoride exporter
MDHASILRDAKRLHIDAKYRDNEAHTQMLLAMIAAGGALGALARYAISAWLHERFGPAFPWGTIAVNLLGSFLLGVVLPFMELEATAAPLRGFVTVGAVGAMTTFSTFAYETTVLLRDSKLGIATLYVSASLGLGLAVLFVGLWLGSSLAG